MANNAISQAPVEALVFPNPKARVSHEPVEVLVYPNPKNRLTQQGVEVLVGPPPARWRPRVTFWWFD